MEKSVVEWLETNFFFYSPKIGRPCQGVKIIFDNFFIFARNKSKMLKNYQFLGVSACFLLTNLLQFEIHNSYDLRHVPWKARFWFLSPRSDASSIFCFSIDLQNSNWNKKKLLCFLSDVKRRTMPNFVFQGRFSKLIGFFREINMTMYRRNLSSRLHGIYVWVRDGIVKGRTQSSAWLLATSGDANVSTASVRQHLSTTVYTLFF